MENLIPVLVILGVVGFILWKNKDKITAVADKFKKPAPEAPYKLPEPPISVAPIEVKPEPRTPTVTDLLYGYRGEATVDKTPPPVDAGGGPVPTSWANERVVCSVEATTYYIASDSPKHGYMVTGRTGGFDARFNGTVGGTTLYPVNGIMTLTVDKPCQAVFAPIVG